jgi:hypothetical protein
LGRLRLLQAKYAGAELPLREAYHNYEKMDPDNWQRYYAQNLLGASLAGQRKYAEAEPLLLVGYQGMLLRQASIAADDRPKLQEAGAWVVRLYHDWGKPEKATSWRENIRMGR